MTDISDKCSDNCEECCDNTSKQTLDIPFGKLVPKYPKTFKPVSPFPMGRVPVAVDVKNTQESSDLPDSGNRENFSTGSVRDTRDGKGRFDLISPIALKRIAQHYEKGAVKYEDRNWEKGQPLMRYFDSALRHLNSYTENLLTGRSSKEDNLAACLWNIMAFIHTEYMIKQGLLSIDLDDRPKPQPALVGK